jgi:hypothetical protein
MKEVAIVLLLSFALMLDGCSSTSQTVQVSSGSVWGTQMTGGVGSSSGFSFIIQFSLSGTNMSVSNFQLDNSDTCFGPSTQESSGTSTITTAGSLNVTSNSADQVSGTFTFTMTSQAGDVITLTSTSVTGTGTTAGNGVPLTHGVIMGTWTLVPGGGGSCVASNGFFTMTENT